MEVRVEPTQEPVLRLEQRDARFDGGSSGGALFQVLKERGNFGGKLYSGGPAADDGDV